MKENKNSAELIDTMNKRVALGFLVVSVVYALDVLSFLVSESIETYLSYAGNVFAVLSMVIVIFALWPVFSKKISRAQGQCHESDSFITEALHNSIRISWMVTLFFLVFLMSMNKLRVDLNLPADFYFKLLFFIMMFVVGIDFFRRTRDDSDMESS